MVVIAGAGASRNLGEGQPMPLMLDWAASLRQALDAAEDGLADALGLVPDLSGDRFEERLGSFLAFHAVLPLVEQLQTLGGPNPRTRFGEVATWLANAQRRTGEIVEAIRLNVFDSFGYARFNDGLAQLAYDQLRSWLARPGEDTFLAFATTNYDACIEVALGRLGFTVLDGFEHPGVAGYTTPVLRPLSMAERARQSTGQVPVVHLHGGVGWYRMDDGEIRRLPNEMDYNRTIGEPAILLPDAAKTAGSFLGGEGLWAEFGQLLQGADNVIILGHSLNDDHVVKTVREYSACPIAVTWYSPEEDPEGSIYNAETARVRELIPDATVIRTDFGPNGTIDQGVLGDWLAGTNLR